MIAPLLLAALIPPEAGAQELSEDMRRAVARAGERRDEFEAGFAGLGRAGREAYAFLLRHMPARDFARVAPALLLESVELAQRARAAVPWGSQLSEDLFHNFVVPYAQADETRESWRPSMTRQFLPLVADCQTPGEAAQVLNREIFNKVNVHYSTGRKRALASPSESIAQGKATCTGLSILLADACRACCVPARLVSVRWPHKAGNHTWVEVWDGAAWRFCGADEPDPAGLDRAWFVGDARKCADADRAHRVWAVSFAATGERFAAGWGAGRLWGVDVTARYAPKQRAATAADGDGALLTQLARFFAADASRRATFEFDRNLDEELRTKQGDARLRALVWKALRQHERPLLQPDYEARVARAGGKTSPFTVKQVGEKPAAGWPLVIAMHGGGGVKKAINDAQWREMQSYYKDHPEVSGYLYCALRAPTDQWNGFYTDYFYPVLEKLIRQFVVCDDVDPAKVFVVGYSHGGYGAFAVGPKLPHRFAAVHSSAAAPTDGQSLPDGLHSLPFTFMVGGEDTRYGRRARCEAFAARLAALRAANPGRYPGSFTLVPGKGHGGLPDRDLLASMLTASRTAAPRHLTWRQSDGVVRDHYWLHVEAPKPGTKIDAELLADAVLLSDLAKSELWLDARLVDMAKPFTVISAPLDAEFTPAPSLRTLCETMARRGDPELAATWVLPLPPAIVK
ncbi:MAG: transglutaminase domain-containing protein [Planctomycetota bacterium]|nr:transglutaminase domain-containing protein [Planctomycetota bacterium]